VNKTGMYLVMLCVVGVTWVLSGVVFNKYSVAQQLINECQAELPRKQRCELYARPVLDKGDKDEYK